MQKLKTKLNTWWDGLTPRERFLTQAAFIVILLFLCYEIFWVHIETKIQEKNQSIYQEIKIWQMINRSVAQIQYNKTQHTQLRKININPDNLLSITQQQIKKTNFVVNPKINSVENNQVRIIFTDVSFNKLSTWIMNFTREYKLNVFSAQLNSTSYPTKVTAEIMFNINATNNSL